MEKRKRLELVVRDVHRRDAKLTLEPLELEAHLLAQLQIEAGERLVEQEEPRLGHERARQREALLLPARQTRRRPPRNVTQPHGFEHATDARRDLRLR